MGSILAVLLCTGLVEDRPAAAPPRVLTCARDIRLLAPDRAVLGLPVRLEAVVTYIDAGNTVFVQDDTAGTHVHNFPRDTNWRVGHRVRVEGVTMPGLYIPGIKASRIVMLGPGKPPQPQRVTVDELASGIYHYQTVVVEGVGRSAAATGENASSVRLAVGSRVLELRVDEVLPEGLDLVDARVRVEGLAAGVINNRRQLVSPYLKVRSFRRVEVLDPPVPAPELREVQVDELLRYAPEGITRRRVKVRGVVVSSAQGGEPVFVREGDRAIMVDARTSDPLQPGDMVEALGFPEMGTYRAFLADATLRRVGRVAPPAPRRMTIGALLKGTSDADLVELEGELVASYPGPQSQMLVLQSGPTTFRVLASNVPAKPWAPGSRLAVRGICRIEGAGGPSNRDYNFHPASFEIWSSAPDGVRLLSMPSWWTPRRLSAALAALVVATAAALVWILVLRRRVRAQKAIIRAQLTREVVLEERQRIAREVHDTLEQELVGLALRLDAAASVADSRTHSLLDATRRLVTRIQAEVRNLVWNLREASEGPTELGQALAHLAGELQQASPARLRVAVSGPPWSLPGPVEHNLLRIAQEALTNALKHADPHDVEVEVRYEADHLAVRIRDDGRGFDPDGPVEPRPGHFGLIGMRERARKIAAQLELASAAGRGTTVEVRVPRPRPEKRGIDVGSPSDHRAGGG
jgi:signal transduction histidine kinase